MSSVGVDATRKARDPASCHGRRPLLTHQDLDAAGSEELVSVALDLAAHPEKYEGALEGRRVGLLFSAPSTRTRAAFWRSATDLGSKVISFGPDDLQLSTGETWGDTGLVLAEYLDAVIVPVS